MIRGILAGLFWGAVLGGAGLAVVSLTSPLPEGRAVSGAPMAPPVVPAVPTAPAVTPAGPDVAPPGPAPALPDAPQPVIEAPVGPETGANAPVVPDVVVPAAPATGAMPGGASPPATPDSPMPEMPAPTAPGLPVAALPPAGVPEAAPLVAGGQEPPKVAAPAAPAAAAPDAVQREAPLAPVPSVPGAVPPGLTGPAQPAEAAPVLPPADPVPEPPRPAAPGQAEEERLADGPQVLPVPPVPPQPGVMPAGEPAAPAEPAARPQPGFSGAVDGVRTGRLPSIAGAEAPAEVAPAGALDRNARPFENPEGKPPFAILLLDEPGAEVDLATVAASPLPLTLVVDPAQPDAADRAARWRAAGQEVALLASGLPQRGGATDMEVAMEALATGFPDALALADLPADGGQAGRAWAGAVVPALAARGYGLVTWDQGLNAADQVARREGLPAVTVFRDLDGKDEAAPVIRRYLDRAAFKAQQDGRAVVLGRLRPETVAMLLEWALDGRAASLALAPLSAVFPR